MVGYTLYYMFAVHVVTVTVLLCVHTMCVPSIAIGLPVRLHEYNLYGRRT